MTNPHPRPSLRTTSSSTDCRTTSESPTPVTLAPTHSNTSPHWSPPCRVLSATGTNRCCPALMDKRSATSSPYHANPTLSNRPSSASHGVGGEERPMRASPLREVQRRRLALVFSISRHHQCPGSDHYCVGQCLTDRAPPQARRAPCVKPPQGGD